MTKPAAARQADIERTLKAIRKAGYPTARVIIEPGRLTILAGPAEGAVHANSFDEIFG